MFQIIAHFNIVIYFYQDLLFQFTCFCSVSQSSRTL